MTESIAVAEPDTMPARRRKKGRTAAEDVALWRERYPDALVCIACGRLLATQRESYAKSGLTEAERLEYVCAECRQAAAEAEVVTARRREILAANVAASKTASPRLQEPSLYTYPGSCRNHREALHNPSESRRGNGGFSDVEHVTRRLGRFFRTFLHGGRPRVPAAEQKSRRRERDLARRVGRANVGAAPAGPAAVSR